MSTSTLLIGLVGVLAAGAAASILAERREWNGGVCKKSGKPWRYFDSDSEGGRGYTDGEHYCWISWPFVDRERAK